MADLFLPFFVVLLLVSILLRDQFIFTLLYIFIGITLLGRFWTDKALRAIEVQRRFSPRAFFGERIPISLQIQNRGRLPLIWAQVSEAVASEIGLSTSERRIISLSGSANTEIGYTLVGRRRGRYPVGPFQCVTSDIFGLASPSNIKTEAEFLTVYPKIVRMTGLRLPATIPLGRSPIRQPIFEDPSRAIGKRDYAPGDPIRRLDWKSSASAGRMLVKQYEPSISMEAAIFLSFTPEEYYRRRWIDSTELAVVAAASIANRLIEDRQAVGLFTNGHDALSVDGVPSPIPPRKGRTHLIHILELLARIQARNTEPIHSCFQEQLANLPWGTTVILITGLVDEALLEELVHARRKGLPVLVLLIGVTQKLSWLRSQASVTDISVLQIHNERDLKWGLS